MNQSREQHRRPVSRRSFLRAAGALSLAAGCGRQTRRHRPGNIERVIVMGVDGMDPVLLRRFVAEGRMPNCQRLMTLGSFQPLATSNPPQSPVAWSNFISGTNPGGHGIFDFIARDPETMLPYQSISRLASGGKPIRFGKYQLPTSAGKLSSLRHGATLWNELEQHGVPCTVFRMPANFPPSESEATTLSGMGTPDLQGTNGTFTFFTDDDTMRTREVSGGRIERVLLGNHVLECRLRGPVNEFVTAQEQCEVPVTIDRDPDRSVVRMVIQDQTLILREKEWSDWIVVKFPLVPYAVEVSGICRFYLKSVHRPFALYVTPININPADPSLPLSTPPDYSRQLVKELGYYYTQGLVEDTHALSASVLDAEEYRQQALFVHEERMRFFEHELARFRDGFLFYYFSTLDLSCHMFWQTIDENHPRYSTEDAKKHGDFIRSLYERVDHAIGLAMEQLDDKTWLMVMSDHGFTSFRRQFNLNSWLLENGLLRTRRAPVRNGSTDFQDVDWTRSRAYGLGLNGLYLNRAGREKWGPVRDAEATALENDLIRQLQQFRDPVTGEKVIANVFRAADVYSGPYVNLAPDLLIGYHRHYRASWDTILGGFPSQIVSDNTNAWSGDHCIDPQFVPGVLLSNRPLVEPVPRLEDLAPTILDGFQVPVPETMTGRVLSTT